MCSTPMRKHGDTCARAVLIPPRQNILCQAKIFALPDGGQATVFGTTQGSRNMLSLKDNLNAVDAVQKVITFTFDGQKHAAHAASRPSRNPPQTGKPLSRGNPVPSASDELAQGVETSAKAYQMVLGPNAVSGAGAVPALLNGGRAGAVNTTTARKARWDSPDLGAIREPSALQPRRAVSHAASIRGAGSASRRSLGASHLLAA